jgi:hypothetical protein
MTLDGHSEINTFRNMHCKLKKGKAIPITGHGGAWGCEMSRLKHFLDNRLVDDGDVVRLKRQSTARYSQKDLWNSFLLEAEPTPGAIVLLKG